MEKHIFNLVATTVIVVAYFALLLLAYNPPVSTAREINDEKYINELETHFGPIPLPPKEKTQVSRDDK